MFYKDKCSSLYALDGFEPNGSLGRVLVDSQQQCSPLHDFMTMVNSKTE